MLFLLVVSFGVIDEEKCIIVEMMVKGIYVIMLLVMCDFDVVFECIVVSGVEIVEELIM